MYLWLFDIYVIIGIWKIILIIIPRYMPSMDEQFTVFNIPGVHITHPTTGVGHRHHHHHHHHGQGHHRHIKASCHHRRRCSSHFSSSRTTDLTTRSSWTKWIWRLVESSGEIITDLSVSAGQPYSPVLSSYMSAIFLSWHVIFHFPCYSLLSFFLPSFFHSSNLRWTQLFLRLVSGLWIHQ